MEYYLLSDKKKSVSVTIMVNIKDLWYKSHIESINKKTIYVKV